MSSTSIHRKILELEAQMAQAVAAEDFETAAVLRNQIRDLAGQQTTGNAEAPVVRQPPPGQMGLGTHIPVAAPPSGWRKPKKPDPMTNNFKPRRGR